MPLFDDVKDFFTIKDDSYYYDKLYPLQDEILALTFSQPLIRLNKILQSLFDANLFNKSSATTPQ